MFSNRPEEKLELMRELYGYVKFYAKWRSLYVAGLSSALYTMKPTRGSLSEVILEAILKGAALHTDLDAQSEVLRALMALFLLSSLVVPALWSVEVASRFLDLGGADILLRDMSPYQGNQQYMTTLFERRRLLMPIRASIENGEMPRHVPLLTRMNETLEQDNAQIPPVGNDWWIYVEEIRSMAGGWDP